MINNIPIPRLLKSIIEKSGTKTFHVVEAIARDSWSQPEVWKEYHDTAEEALESVRENNSRNKPGPAPDFYVTKKYLGEQTFKLKASWVKV